MIIDKSGSLCGPSQFKELKKPADHNVWLGGQEVDVHVDSKYVPLEHQQNIMQNARFDCQVPLHQTRAALRFETEASTIAHIIGTIFLDKPHSCISARAHAFVFCPLG